MRWNILAALAGLWLAFAPAAAAQAPAPPPLEAFGALPTLLDVALSPEGDRVALVRSTPDGARRIDVIDIASRQLIFAATPPEGTTLRSAWWPDQNHVAFRVSATLNPESGLLRALVRYSGSPDRVLYVRNGVINLRTGQTLLLSAREGFDPRDFGGELIVPWRAEPDTALIVAMTIPPERTAGATRDDDLGGGAVRMRLIRMALDGDSRRELTVNGVSADTIALYLNEGGAVVAREDLNDEANVWRLYVYDGQTPRLLREEADSGAGASIDVVGLLGDGHLAAIEVAGAQPFARLIALDRATGAENIVFAREGFDVEDVIYDPWTRRVVGATWIETETKQTFFEADLAAAAQQSAAAFPNTAVSLLSWSRDRAHMLVYAERGQDGGAYYRFSPATGESVQIGYRYPDIAAAAATLGERQSITYRARDGVRIPAYLTLPTGVEPSGLPLIVLVHGGPHGVRETMDFDWWASFLASRGYAVLQPNFRGSGGYGAAWQSAGYGQWGRLMQTDVDDGATALGRAGIVDPARVCIMGASYGGFAALAGATLTPGMYRCAVSVNGVTDLDRFLRDRIRNFGEDSGAADWWQLSIGDREEDRAALRAVSPYHNAAAARVPILLIASTEDSVVFADHSARMRDALREAGASVTFVSLDGDDHWLSNGATRTAMLRAIDAFLAEHLPADAP